MTGPRSTHANGKLAEASPEAVLSALIETSDDAIITADGAGRITAWSATAERLFGRPAGGVVGHTADGLFPLHLRPGVRAAIARVAAGERVRHFETEVWRPDGMSMPVYLSMCPVLDVGEMPVGVMIVARDVTEQRLAQATLAEVEGRLAEGEALAHVGSWLWDVRTDVVQWSTEFHRIHGVDPLDFGGTFESHLGVVDRSDRQRVRDDMERSVASGRPFDLEYRIVRPDDEIRLVRVRAQPTMGSAGKAIGLRGIGQDITERRAPVPTGDRPDA